MKKRMKIGLFIDSFFPAIDGVNMAVDNLAKELSEYSDVVVIAPYYKDCDDSARNYRVKRIKGVSVPFTEYKLINKKTSWSDCYKELIAEEFDVIHIHSPFNIGRLGIKVAKNCNIPCLGTVHTRFDFEIKRIVNIKSLINILTKVIISAYNRCDKCIVVNDPLIEDLKKYGCIHKNPTVIYNGTDLKPIKTDHNSYNKINELYGLKNQKNVLLFVGRIIDIKNIFFILEALKILKEQNFDFKMLYVGTGPNENQLKAKIKKYCMEDKVIMTGKIENRDTLSLIYKRADLLLFPSLMDTSGLVRVEAAVNETPGLFIEDSMVGSTVTNNVNGFTSSLDVEEFAKKIVDILSDKKLLKKVSLNARLMLTKSWKEVAKETYNIYLKEIKNNKRKFTS